MTGEPAPEVSVIVRSTDRDTLGAALASIAAQEGASLEAIVVAASGPAHRALGKACGPHPLRFIASERALTRPQAANAGLDAAAGEWITFLDDDDELAPDHIGGLLAARADDPQARVITSYAIGALRDGHVERVGQPFSLMQLYERNFIHLSSAIFQRSLLAEGFRFDEDFDILQDWDFMLQLAQSARFHFVPRETFRWNADVGASGAGGGANENPERFARYRDRIYAKWGPSRDALVERTSPLLERAATLARAGALDDASDACDAVLALSPNDPWALNLRALLLRQSGRIDEAREVQRLAVSVRPTDAAMLYNLALLDRAANDLDAARRNVHEALALDPAFAAARALAAALGNSSTPSA